MFTQKKQTSSAYSLKPACFALAFVLAFSFSGNAFANGSCRDALTGEFSYRDYAAPRLAVAKENSKAFKSSNETSKLVISKFARLKALHIHNPSKRFPDGARLHAVIFDSFGSSTNDYLPAQRKIQNLSQTPRTGENIKMGAEAFAPHTPLKSAAEVAAWMRDILLEVQSERPDNRPVVIYVRGALAEGAALLSKQNPELASALVIENPRSGLNPSEIPEWNQDSFGIPTFIATGTHNANYSSALKQKIYDLSKSLNEISRNDPSATPVHFLDMPFADADVFDSTPHNIAHTEIHRFLRKHVLPDNTHATETISPERFVELAQSTGIGSRRFFGHNPKPTPENEINAIKSGVLMWEIGLKAVRTLEEARAHIEKLRSLNETKPSNHVINNPLFFISDSPLVGSLNNSNNLESAVSHFSGSSPQRLIDDAIANGNKFFWLDEAGNVQEFNPSRIQGVPTEAVFAGDNKNGFMFNLSGWTLPVIRGVINLERAVQTSAYKNGNIFFNGAVDRKGNLKTKGLVHEGYKFERNKNLAAVLEKLRHTHRKGQSDNATRFLDPYNIVLMQRLYEANMLDTLELYNEKGELVAGGLIVKIDNVWSPETIFYPQITTPLSSDPKAPMSATLEGIDFGKAVISEMINEGIRLGHTEFDSQIASSLTIMFGAVYTSTDNHFLPTLKETNETWADRQLARQQREAERQAIIEKNYAEAAEQLNALKKKIEDAKLRFAELDAVATKIEKEAETGLKPTPEQKQNPEFMAALKLAREVRKGARAAATAVRDEITALETELRALEYELNHKGLEKPHVVDPIAVEEAKVALAVAVEKAEKAQVTLKLSQEQAAELEAEAARLQDAASLQKAKIARNKATGVEKAVAQALARVEEAKAILNEAEGK